jgi:hypothetical protein
MKKAKPEDVNMQPVGFRITQILTDYSLCPKTSWALIGNINATKYPYATGIKIMWKYSIPQTKKAKPEDVNMQPVGFRITRILPDYIICPKTSRALIGHINTAKYPYPTGIKTMWKYTTLTVDTVTRMVLKEEDTLESHNTHCDWCERTHRPGAQWKWIVTLMRTQAEHGRRGTSLHWFQNGWHPPVRLTRARFWPPQMLNLSPTSARSRCQPCSLQTQIDMCVKEQAIKKEESGDRLSL